MRPEFFEQAKSKLGEDGTVLETAYDSSKLSLAWSTNALVLEYI